MLAREYRNMRKLCGEWGGAGVTDNFIITIMVMISQVYTYGRTYEILHFTYTQFAGRQVYLNKATEIFVVGH